MRLVIWYFRMHHILKQRMNYFLGILLVYLINIVINRTLSIIGLVLIAFGTGGIKPCVSAFGGDQFEPHQVKQLQRFFSLFYLAINAGSLLSTFLTPVFREDISCSSRGDCFPLAFGVPAALMIVSVVLFVIGKPLYKIVPAAKGNIVVQTTSCTIVKSF